MASDEGRQHDPGEAARRARIDDLVLEYVDRLNAGDRVDRQEIFERHPELAAELLEQLRTFMDLADEAPSKPLPVTLGDYTLSRQIGQGGMGVVYEAWENSMDRRVALKVLPRGVAADVRALQRFIREAKTAGQLSHPNVVSVYAMGVKEQTPYYAMEYVEGETLAQMLRRLKRAGPEVETPFGKKDEVRYFASIAEVFAAVADGLQHSHSRGVIHRDLKPSNLILDRDVKAPSSVAFTLRILDFGLAHLEGQESLTASGDLLGTVLYMSPEQARRKQISVDHRTDIYSLGATLYEMLSGRPPFQGKDHGDTLSQIIDRDPVEPRKWSPRIPRDLEMIVLKCLRKESAERYGTAEALGQDLRRFVRGDPVEARPESRWEKLSRRVRRHRTAVLAAGVLAVLLGALGWQAWERQMAEREALEAARIVHDATVRDAAIELSGGQLTLLGLDIEELGSVLYLFRPRNFWKGPAGVEDVLRELERAAEAVPRPDAPYYMARIYRLAGDEESAGREAARALARAPEFVPAEVLAREVALARVPLGGPEIEAVLDRYKGKPSWQEPWLLAYKHVRSRNWPEAAKAYGRLLELREPEPYVGFAVECFMGHGLARLRSEDFPGAISDFAAARGIWPRLSEAAIALGLAWYRAGQAGETERIFREFHAGSPEGSKSEMAAWIMAVYAKAGDRAKADEWLERVDGWPRDAIDCMHLFLQGRHEECIEKAREFLEARPDDVSALTLLGWSKMFNQWRRRGPLWDGERREILELARKACALYPNHRNARILLAEALQVNGRPEEALSTIEGVIRLRMRTNQEDCTDLAVQGVILYLQGKFEEAERVLLEALERHPGNGVLLNELAIAYERQGRNEEAEREFRALIDRGDGSANRYGHLAVALNRLGRYEEAAEAAEEALRRLPKNTSAYEDLAFALWKLGRSEEGLEAAEAGIRELPGREHLHLVKGRILGDLGKLEEAAKEYCQELDLRLDDLESHEALGGLLRKRPELASIPEVQAVGEAIERRRSAGSCEAFLLETLSLIREHGKEGSGAPVPGDK